MSMGRLHIHRPGRREASRKGSARLQLERLETRELLATFVVTSTGDGTPGSLRLAILQSNSTPGPNIIRFQLTGAGPFVIQPKSPLPGITQPVSIDGTTQPGYKGTPLVEIDGSNVTSNGQPVQGLSFF